MAPLICAIFASLLPWYHIMPVLTLGGVNVTYYHLALICFSALTLPILIVRRILTRSDLYLFLLLFVFALTALLSGSKPTIYLVIYNMFVPVFIYYIIRTWLQSPEKIEKSLKYTLILLTLFSVACLIMASATGFTRGVKLFNIAAVSRASIIAVAFCGVLYLKPFPKPVNWLCLLINFTALFLSYSRAFLVLCVGSLILWKFISLPWVRKKFFLWFWLLSIAITSTLCVYGSTFDLQTYTDAHRAIYGDQSYDSVREQEKNQGRVLNHDLWLLSIRGRALAAYDAFSEFSKAPVIGTSIKRISGMVTIHNFQLEYLVYGGIVGYLFAMLFWLSAGKSLGRSESAICRLSLMLVVIILANAVFNGILHGLFSYIVFMVLGYGMAFRHAEKKNCI